MKYPDEKRMLVIRPCVKIICLNIKPAARLLSHLLYLARNCDEQEATFTVSCTQQEIIEGLVEEIDVKTLHRTAIPMLRLLGFLDVDGSSYRYTYTVHIDLVQHCLSHSNNKEQLDKILIVSMKEQLDKCLIQIDKSPIELVKSPIEFDKLLIPFRQMSNSKRGRKARPQVALKDISEDSRLLEIDKITEREEESTGEQSDTATFASSDSDDASPSLEIDTHSQEITPQEGDTAHATTPLDPPPAVAADQPRVPGETIVAAESRTALDRGAPHRVQSASEYDVPTSSVAQGGVDDGQLDDDAYILPGSADRTPPLPSADMGDISPSGQDLRSLSPASRMALEAAQEEIDKEATVPCLAAVTPSEQSSSLSVAVELGQGAGSPLPAAPATQYGTNEQERSHVQNRDTLPRPVAVTRDSGSSPRPTPLADPGVSPPQMHVLIVKQQFASADEWRAAQETFIATLRGVWKGSTATVKQSYKNFTAYRKQHLDRWLEVNPDPSIVRFTPDGKTLFDEWCSLFKARVDAGKATIEAANWLAERLTTWAGVLTLSRVEVLRNFKGWCYTNDKNGYYTRGVKLFDLRREFEGWQSYQQSLLDKAERGRPQNKYGTVSGLPRLEIDPEWLAAVEGR